MSHFAVPFPSCPRETDSLADFNACTAQYGAPSGGWGRQYGGKSTPIISRTHSPDGKSMIGVTSDAQCSQLPANLQAGCHWRWQWYAKSRVVCTYNTALNSVSSLIQGRRRRKHLVIFPARGACLWLLTDSVLHAGKSRTSKSIVRRSSPAFLVARQRAFESQACFVETALCGRKVLRFPLLIQHYICMCDPSLLRSKYSHIFNSVNAMVLRPAPTPQLVGVSIAFILSIVVFYYQASPVVASEPAGPSPSQ